MAGVAQVRRAGADGRLRTLADYLEDISQRFLSLAVCGERVSVAQTRVGDLGGLDFDSVQGRGKQWDSSRVGRPGQVGHNTATGRENGMQLRVSYGCEDMSQYIISKFLASTRCGREEMEVTVT